MDTRDFNKFHDLIFTFVRVISKPRMDVTIMIPTKMKEMCWDQNFTWDEEKEQRDVKMLHWNGKVQKKRTLFFSNNKWFSFCIHLFIDI